MLITPGGVELLGSRITTHQNARYTHQVFDLELRLQQQQNLDRWNTGTAPDARAYRTLFAFVKGNPKALVQNMSAFNFPETDAPEDEFEQTPMSEEAQIIHELGCGGNLEFMASWSMEAVKVPSAFYCSKCNKLFVQGTSI